MTSTTEDRSQNVADVNSSYSTVTKSKPPSKRYPQKDQAIVLNVIEALRLPDYVIAVGSITGPKNVLYASRIANNRVCIFLSSCALADQFVKDHPTLDINEYAVSVRKLITPAKRIILSNICPSVPDEFLEDVIRNIGLQALSQVSSLKVGMPGDEYAHLLSFRRQIYVKPDDDIILPSSIVVKHDNVNYRIYLTYDELICFSCRQKGHIASSCTSNNEGNSRTSDAPNTTTEQGSANMIIQKEPVIPTTAENNQESGGSLPASPMEVNIQNTNKRSLSTESSLVEQTEITQTESIQTTETANEGFLTPSAVKPTSKKYKRVKTSTSIENPEPINNLLSPAKKYIEEQSKQFPLNYDQLVLFMENVQGSRDPLSVARKFTKDVPLLVDMLFQIYPQVKERSIKTRITRIRSKIKKQLEGDSESINADSDTDTSQTSHF